MSSSLAGAFAVAALFVAVLALVFAIQALRARTAPPARPAAPAPTPEPEPETHPEPKPGTVKSELRKLTKDLTSTRADLKLALQHLAVVRYDAFGDTGGKLSWSMALLDDNGNGVVLTSINSRADARTYAKEIKTYTSDSKLSPEEQQALQSLQPTTD
ncbi:DUF4446 family protein [Kribbella solani]|uniref:DUF4446 family protein n=1 Tax=Kribbella solani TaxID=236067 RepID=A0A841DT43_9ACTN|nr:DUF4446 family protein [Kribbella solani]MBB5981752.1 hypothetical protein [Kribbella solani]MDX3001471.1 DUF4446 family protein [Kribbella solani]